MWSWSNSIGKNTFLKCEKKKKKRRINARTKAFKCKLRICFALVPYAGVNKIALNRYLDWKIVAFVCVCERNSRKCNYNPYLFLCSMYFDAHIFGVVGFILFLVSNSFCVASFVCTLQQKEQKRKKRGKKYTICCRLDVASTFGLSTSPVVHVDSIIFLCQLFRPIRWIRWNRFNVYNYKHHTRAIHQNFISPFCVFFAIVVFVFL